MQDELLNVGATERVKRLRTVAKAALDLSQWAAEGRSDYFLAAQLSLLVRQFSQALEPSDSYPDLSAVLDFLGMSIQSAVGKAQSTKSSPAAKAVAPIHETVLEAK